jgi:Cu+-exporting ATPase
VRDAGMLEAMGQVDVVVWDKTGTLTSGAPSVESVTAVGDQDTRVVLRLAAGAEGLSTHPVAQAIVAQARREAVGLPEAEAFESVPGRGVAAVVDGVQVTVGSVRFLRERGVETQTAAGVIDRSGPHAGTIVVVGLDGYAAGVIRVRDTVRPSAASAVRRLERLGVRSEMLTGDALEVARSVAQQVGISDVEAEADPSGKVERVRALRRQGLRVAMVGDGVNDAAALAAADVGIAFATGAELACEAAGIQLVGSTPHAVADAVTLAKAGVRIIRENLFWAFAYNVLMIPLAALGLLPPAVAAGAMMASSLTVVFNALRLPRVTRWSAGASVSKATAGSLEQGDPRGEIP